MISSGLSSKTPSVRAHDIRDRLGQFAKLFRSYINASTIILSLVPIPVTFGHLFPAFKAIEGIMSVSATLFCMLMLCYVFYLRHAFKTWFYPVVRTQPALRLTASLFPVVLIGCSAACFFAYHHTLLSSVSEVHDVLVEHQHTEIGMNKVLEQTEFGSIPDWGVLVILYLTMFVTAECAFLVMALKEYLQDTLQLSESDY